LFAGDKGLFRVSDTGGIPQAAIKIGAESKLRGHAWPQFLPDGHSFLFYAEDMAASNGSIYAGDLASDEIRKLVDQSGPGVLAEGRLLYSRNGVLLAQPFDPLRIKVNGDPVPVLFANPIFGGDSHSSPGFSSGHGILAARTGGETLTRLTWIDRNGKNIEQSGEPAAQGDFALAPDGNSVAVVRRNGDSRGEDLWLLDLRRNVASRLTFDNLDVHTPVWSPDGKRIAYYTSNGRDAGLRQVSANGSGKVELLLKTPEPVALDCWSPDGKVLIYTEMGRRGKQSLWTLPAEGDRTPQSIVQGEFNYGQAALSPDGRWMIYVSDESGKDEVYVRTFPPGGDRWVVSAGGGSQPSWRRDGREIDFVSPQRMLTAVPIRSDRGMELGTPAALFRLPRSRAYQGTPGDRFLVAVPVEGEHPEIQVVMNWATEN
jgi:dipeptidyl aminopeptidase/acylaminoacyl peptidase